MSKDFVKPEMSSLFMDFARYFELTLALTDEQKAAVYAVRYNVYCEEFGYEDPDAFRDRMETDAFEDQSIHCLVIHRASGVAAGCVRLVTVEADTTMPMEDHCHDSLDQDFFGQLKNRRATMAEISRLAVDSQFRRRRGESETRFGNTASLHFAAREERTFSLIAVSLFLAAAAAADIVKRPDCFAIMEPFLPVILRRTGIVVKRVGDDFDFKGVRAPYYLNITEAIRAAPSELSLCFDVVRSQFVDVLAPEGKRVASRISEHTVRSDSGLMVPSGFFSRASA